MITWALIASAVIALMLVVLVQGKWTSRDSCSQPSLLSRHGYGDRSLRQSDQLADAQAIFLRRRHRQFGKAWAGDIGERPTAETLDQLTCLTANSADDRASPSPAICKRPSQSKPAKLPV